MNGSRRTILLTGGTGFLGSQLLKQLVAGNYDVIVLKRSTSDTQRIKAYGNKIKAHDIDKRDAHKVFEENYIHTIIHCAADYGKKHSNASDVIEANVLFPVKLLQYAKTHQVSCFINTDTILDAGNNNYALSKKQFYDWFKSFKESLCCINVKIEQFYGPGEGDEKFITSMVSKLIHENDKIDLTLGEQERGFLYIDDVISGYMTILNSSKDLKKDFYEFELGCDDKTKIKDLVTMIKRMTGNTETKLDFGAIPYRKNELMEYRLNLDAIHMLDWHPQTTLKEGIQKVIDFNKSQ